MDKTSVFREELFGRGKSEQIHEKLKAERILDEPDYSDDSENSDSAEYSADTAEITGLNEFKEFEETDDDVLHDIEFDESTERPISDKALKRAREARKQLKKQRQARRTVIRIILGVAVSAAVIFFGVRLGSKLYDIITDFGGMQNSEFEVAVEIPENPTVEQVAQALSESGIVQEPEAFRLYFDWRSTHDSEWRHSGESFEGGEFILSSSMNYSTIIDTLLPSGVAKTTVNVTIIEGMTAVEIGKLLEDNYVCRAEDFEKFYREKMDKYDFERRVTPSSLKFNQLEGYLFPDQYEFYECHKLKMDPNADIDTSGGQRKQQADIFQF